MYRMEENRQDDNIPYPMTESYWSKRVFAYVIDLIISFLLALSLMLVFNNDLSTPVAWGIIYIMTAITMYLLALLFELLKSASIGKMIMKMKVISLYGEVTFSQAVKRNLLSLLPVVGPLLDMLLGKTSQMDERQKLLDKVSDTLVVEVQEAEVERPRAHYHPPPPPTPKEKMSLGFPDELRTGKCPRCNAPFRMLREGDESFSGLWNYRCTWCNTKVFESNVRRRYLS